jgi:hypothetical protein
MSAMEPSIRERLRLSCNSMRRRTLKCMTYTQRLLNKIPLHRFGCSSVYLPLQQLRSWGWLWLPISITGTFARHDIHALLAGSKKRNGATYLDCGAHGNVSYFAQIPDGQRRKLITVDTCWHVIVDDPSLKTHAARTTHPARAQSVGIGSMQGLGQYLFNPARTGPRHSNRIST